MKVSQIERRLGEPSRHLLLVGMSGTGKDNVPSFVASLLEMPSFRLKLAKNYSIDDFDADLQKILRACLDSHIYFIIRENDLILPVFTERLNVLLAESRIPGLFTSDQLEKLTAAVKETARIDRKFLEDEDSVMTFFVSKVKTSLHIVFTVNAPEFDINQIDVMFPSLL
jgi:dynein heavy chain 1